MAAFLDPLFHADLLLVQGDYEIAKHTVLREMHQMDSTLPNISTISSSTASRVLSSATNSDRMLSFKSSLINMNKKKRLHLYQINR